MKKYSLPNVGRAMIRAVYPSLRAPGNHVAPMQNSPKQALNTQAGPRDLIDYSQAGPVLDLVQRMHTWDVVQRIAVRQPGYIPLAPHVPIGAKTLDIPDQRFGILQYPENRAQNSYVFGSLAAPAKLQSVPSYIVKQKIRVGTSATYPKTALRAPKPQSGGGQCSDG